MNAIRKNLYDKLEVHGPHGSPELEQNYSWVYKQMSLKSISSPLGKGHCPLIEQNCTPLTQGCFKLSLDGIGPVVLKKDIFKCSQNIFAIISPWPFI